MRVELSALIICEKATLLEIETLICVVEYIDKAIENEIEGDKIKEIF